VQGSGDTAEAGANELGGRWLNLLIATVGRSGLRGTVGVTECSVNENDAACGVVHANVELSTAGASHDVGLDPGVVKCAGGLRCDLAQGSGELEELVDTDG
jgi:hypothetical protein